MNQEEVKVIAKNITIKKDSLFSENELENSYAKLSELSIFKFIDIIKKNLNY